MEDFRAKDIQQLLNIKPIRYEQIKHKAKIKPGIQEVEGTGRSHRYTFKNVIQFAISHHAASFGLPALSIVALLEHIEAFEKETKVGLFDEDTEPKRCDVYLLDYGYVRIFYVDTDNGSKLFTRISKGIPVQNYLSMELGHQFYDERNSEKYLRQLKDVLAQKSFAELLENAKVYMKMNLRWIKRDILAKL